MRRFVWNTALRMLSAAVALGVAGAARAHESGEARAHEPRESGWPTDYFVAVDGLETLTSGTFEGEPNPNFGRLTLLVAHRTDEDPAQSHFHSIGAYSYVAGEDGGAPGEISTNTNNRIPETFGGDLALRLHPDGRGWRTRWVSLRTESEYSNLELVSIHALAEAPEDSLDGILFRSSGGRWSGSLGGARIALQRVSLTPLLRLSDELGRDLFRRRSRIYLGSGEALHFFPSYSVPRWAEPGTFSATLRLVDVAPGEPRFADSGRFTFDFRVPRRGDLDGDNDVDAEDLAALRAALGEPPTGLDDARDLDGDGSIDAADEAILVLEMRRDVRAERDESSQDD